jgi:glycogenin glucosyltransferase
MLAATVSVLVMGAPAARPAAPPSQLLVLGMHHSGTSLVANLTMMLGANGGAREDMLLHPTNPLKYWERADVVGLDEARLAAGIDASAGRYEMPGWVAYGFDASKAATKVASMAEAQGVVAKLNAQRPWVTKDPRMSLLTSEWMELLDAPACVIVHREPLSIANSMMIYSHNVSYAEWASVYEAYYGSIARACADVPTAIVNHDELTAAPFQALTKLHADLTALGVEGLAMPTEERINQLLRPSQKKQVTYLASERKVLGSTVPALSESISTGNIVAAPVSPWLLKPLRSTEAYATLLTTANVDYFRGALVLGSSIRSFDSTRDLVCLVTASVPQEWRSALTVAGWSTIEVDEVPEFWFGKSEECSRFDKDQGERWGHMATKLRLWQQLKYSRVLYMDADTVLTGDASDIFTNTVGFAAERARYHSYFNAGIMLLTPSQSTYEALTSLGGQEHKKSFGNVIDCTEQGLLNSYYDESSRDRSVTKLAVGRADVAADWQTDSAPFAVHWITHTCPKPWIVADGDETVPSHCDPVVYEYWLRIWSRLTSSATDESSQGSFGSRNGARRMLRRLSGVSAGPSAVHKATISEIATDVHASIGRQLRQIVSSRRELRRRWRRDDEYESGWGENTIAWIAIVGTLVLGLGAGALLHKLFIKAPNAVGKNMTVVQAKRMGFQALGEGKGPVGVVSAVDDDDDDDEEEEEDEPPPKK